MSEIALPEARNSETQLCYNDTVKGKRLDSLEQRAKWPIMRQEQRGSGSEMKQCSDSEIEQRDGEKVKQ